jgi:hypothetical protein
MAVVEGPTLRFRTWRALPLVVPPPITSPPEEPVPAPIIPLVVAPEATLGCVSMVAALPQRTQPKASWLIAGLAVPQV